MAGHETYQLHGDHMAKQTSEFIYARFANETQQSRRLLLKENMWGWFEKTPEYEQLKAMKQVGGSTFGLLTVTENPKMLVLSKNNNGNFTRWTVENPDRPDEWATVPVLDGLIENYVGYVDSNALTTGVYPRVKDVLNESQMEEWREAYEYTKLGTEAKTLVHDYIYPPNIGGDESYQPRFKNLNQLYYSFPQLLQLMSHMGYVDQGRARHGRSLPTIHPSDAYNSCKRSHNRKRRPNVVRWPNQRLKELVGMLIILLNKD